MFFSGIDSLMIAAEKLVLKARNSIGKYCFTECKAYCCRKGYLMLTNKETIMMMKKSKDVLTKIERGKYVLDLGAKGCPSLKNYKCSIHKNPKRPKACKEFPIFIWDKKTIKVSQRCLAVKNELIYPYLAKLKLMGYKISFGREKFDENEK
jgi:Fe-S-cluster containining protein